MSLWSDSMASRLTVIEECMLVDESAPKVVHQVRLDVVLDAVQKPKKCAGIVRWRVGC